MPPDNSYSILPSPCNFPLQQHQPCEPIREQNSNLSAVWLDGMVPTLATRCCKSLENVCNKMSVVLPLKMATCIIIKWNRRSNMMRSQGVTQLYYNCMLYWTCQSPKHEMVISSSKSRVKYKVLQEGIAMGQGIFNHAEAIWISSTCCMTGIWQP